MTEGEKRALESAQHVIGEIERLSDTELSAARYDEYLGVIKRAILAAERRGAEGMREPEPRYCPHCACNACAGIKALGAE